MDSKIQRLEIKIIQGAKLNFYLDKSLSNISDEFDKLMAEGNSVELLKYIDQYLSNAEKLKENAIKMKSHFEMSSQLTVRSGKGQMR